MAAAGEIPALQMEKAAVDGKQMVIVHDFIPGERTELQPPEKDYGGSA